MSQFSVLHSLPAPRIERVAGDRVFRWGIIGSGKICQDFIHALRQVPDAKVVAIGARNLDDAKRVAGNLGIPNAYGSYAEVVQSPEVDVVYVGTVHSRHHEHAILALQAGKPVLVEKAFTQNYKEAAKVLALAKEKNLFVMEAMWARFMPWGVKVRELLASGVIGDVTLANADFCVQFSPSALRIFSPETAGGALLDLGIYPLAAVSLAFGQKPERIHCDGDLLSTGVDGQASIILKFGHNRMGHALCSAIVDSPRYFSIMGTKGRIVVHDDGPPGSAGHFHNSRRVSLTVKKEDGKYYTEIFEFARLPSADIKYNFEASEQLAYEASEVQRCIAAGLTESPYMSHSETLNLMQVLDTVRYTLRAVLPGETLEDLKH